MLNHLSNSNGTLSMESISEIIDHQTLSRQLEEDTSDLMVQHHHHHHHTLGGRSPSPASSVTALSAHDGLLDENDVATTTSVMSGSVHTIIDQHSPTYHTQRIQQQQQHLQHLQQHHHHQQQQHHQEELQQHHHQHQSKHHHLQSHLSLPQRLQLESPVHFVASDNTLDSLSVGSTGSNTMGHIIAVKPEHKLVIVSGNSNGSNNHNNNNNSNINNNCSDHKHNNSSSSLSSEHKKSNCDLTGVLDDLATDDHSTLDSTDQHNYAAHDVHMESDSIQMHHHNQQQHHLQRSHHKHDPPASHNEPLSVIVQNHEDSRDSSTQILSPPELGVVGVGENSLGTSAFQTLTSVVNVEPLSPPDFSSSSAYATLTPLQPLPPISTMSEKFAYGGHISGGGVISSSNTNDATNVDANGNSQSINHSNSQHGQHHQHHQNSLNSLSLSGLSGGEQSPYSSYDKLPTMGMSMTPPHNYGSSPSHTLSGIVVSCDLPSASPGGCGPLSPQSAYSHSTEVQSPPPSQSALVDCKDPSLSNKANIIWHGSNTSFSGSNALQRHVVCLSPVTINGSNVVGDHVIVTDYDTHLSSQQRDLVVPTTTSTSTSSSKIGGRNGSQLHLQSHSPTALSPHSVSASSMHSPGTIVSIVTSNSSLAQTSGRGLMNMTHMTQRNQYQQPQQQHVVSLTPSPPPPNTTVADIPRTLLVAANHSGVANNCDTTTLNSRRLMISGSSGRGTHLLMQATQQQEQSSKNDCSNNSGGGQRQQTHMAIQHTQQQQQQLVQNQQQQQQQHNDIHHHSNKHGNVSSSGSNANDSGGGGGSGGGSADIEEINTKELAQRISAELKRYSIPQAIFAQRVLCRSQGTLSDLLRNPKPWSKLKSGRETFRRMFKWLQEPEFQRMSALRMAAAQIPQRSSNGQGPGIVSSSLKPHIIDNSRHGTTSLSSPATALVNQAGTGALEPVISAAAIQCRRKEEPQMEHMPQPKKPRLVFTDLQRRTLQAIFKETKRPSKEMQVTIARQLGLEPTTVGNFFMNARRRSMDKWRDDDGNITSTNPESKHMTNQTNTSNNSQHSLHGQTQQESSLGAGGNQCNNRNNISNIHIQLSSSSHHHHHHHHHSSLDLDDDDMDLDLVHDDFELNDDSIDDHQHHKDDDDML